MEFLGEILVNQKTEKIVDFLKQKKLKKNKITRLLYKQVDYAVKIADVIGFEEFCPTKMISLNR